MKRTLAALAMTPLALMALAAPATAAKPVVTRTADSGAYAVAGSEFEFGKLFVNATLTRSGPQLNLWYGTVDGAGGLVETSVDTSSGFTFRIDKARLASATLVAEDLQASTCTYQDDVKLGCVNATVDLSLSWLGEGAISRGGSTSREMRDGFKMISHGSGTNRSAAVSGSMTIDGSSVGTFDFAELGTYKNFQVIHCTGDACPPPEEMR